MTFPLTFWDISLWLGITAIILLATAELISPYSGKTNIIIEKRKMRRAALLTGIMSMMTVIARLYGIIIAS